MLDDSIKKLVELKDQLPDGLLSDLNLLNLQSKSIEKDIISEDKLNEIVNKWKSFQKNI